MKKIFIPIVLMALLAAAGCSKERPPYNNPKGGQPYEKKVVVTTVAGSGGESGFQEGAALTAKFAYPEDVSVAPDGTLYVTDLFNGRIRKIKGGQVSTFAGNYNTAGIQNGSGESALFIYPSIIALSAKGVLYTLDGLDPRVREISPGADVSTYAGTDMKGFKDGKVGEAQFQQGAGGLTVDGQGNVYTADTYNNAIRKINTVGDVSTVAGSGVEGLKEGAGTTAQFSHPAGVSIDQQGNLYVADRGNYRIRKITPAGEVSTFAGSGKQGTADGDAGKAQFSGIHDMVIDSQGNLFVTDEQRIRKISKQGVVTTIAGSVPGFADGDGINSKFHNPGGLAVDAADNIYIADTYNQRIRKISFE